MAATITMAASYTTSGDTTREPIGNIPPAGAEARYDAAQEVALAA
jgi:hypothetical protein